MRRPGRVALALFALLLGAYLANGRLAWIDEFSSWDNIPTRYLPFSVLRHGSFYLDDMPRLPPHHPYFVRRVDGHLVSDYPVGTALLAVPVYAPFVFAGVPLSSPLVPWLERISGALLVAASAAVLYLALMRLTEPGAALALTLVYGLGTSALSVSSQGLWQHAGSQLALASSLYCVARGRAAPAWSAASGFPMAFAVVCRPTDALLVAPLAAFVLATRRDWRFVAWALPPVAFQVWYGAAYFGNPLRTQFSLGGGGFTMDLGEGLYGVLLSPGRGLLAYSPVFLLSIAGALLAWRSGGDGILRAISVGIAPTIVLYARWISWHGGLSYGPRLLADLAPWLTALIVPLVPLLRRSRTALGLAVILALWSAAAHAYALVPAWGSHVYHPGGRPLDEALWAWRHHPIVGWFLPRREAAATRPEPFLADLGQWTHRDPRVRLTVNDTTFALGATAHLALAVENDTARALDLYVAVYVPAHGVAAFIPAPRKLTTAVSIGRPEWFRAFRTLPAGARVLEPRLFDFAFPHHLGPGTLYVVAVLVEPGSRPWRAVAADVARLEIRSAPDGSRR